MTVIHGIETIESGDLFASIVRSLTGLSYVVNVYRKEGKHDRRLDSRIRRTAASARKTAHELLKFWAETPSAQQGESHAAR